MLPHNGNSSGTPRSFWRRPQGVHLASKCISKSGTWKVPKNCPPCRVLLPWGGLAVSVGFMGQRIWRWIPGITVFHLNTVLEPWVMSRHSLKMAKLLQNTLYLQTQNWQSGKQQHFPKHLSQIQLKFSKCGLKRGLSVPMSTHRQLII